MTAADADELGPDHDVSLYDVVEALASRVNWAGDETGRDTLDRWLAANAPSDQDDDQADDEDDDDQAAQATTDQAGHPLADQPVTPAARAAAARGAGKPGAKTAAADRTKNRPTPKR